MATFLINTKGDTYQEVLQVKLVVEAMNRQGKFRFEKRPTKGMYDTINIKDFYALNSLEDILVVEGLYKRELFKIAKEQRDRKAVNHRAQASNIVLKINGKEVFNLKDMGQLWEVTDEMLQNKIDEVYFAILGNGPTHEVATHAGFLI